MSLLPCLLGCSSDEREAVAGVLARRGTEDAINALIYIVQHGANPKKINVWQMSTTDYQRHSAETLRDQLIAVRALGQSRSPKALEYLRGLLEPTHVNYVSGATWGSGQDWIEHGEYLKFDNARTSLRGALYFEESTPEGAWSGPSQTILQRAQKRPEHRTILASISDLETCLA